jgi:uncharacterized membrane protein
MEIIEKSIIVQCPISTVYNQWTQFEEFPRFMEGVQEVRQEGDKRLFWRAEIGGKVKEWEAEIFEQTPDQRIAWRSIDGSKNSGRVDFTSLGKSETEVRLTLKYDPEGAIENIGNALGLVSGRVEGDLKRFKEYIEKRGFESGRWRGEIHGREVHPPAENSPGSSADTAPRSQRLRTI